MRIFVQTNLLCSANNVSVFFWGGGVVVDFSIKHSVLLTWASSWCIQANQSLVGFLALGFSNVPPSGLGAEWSLTTDSPA